MADSQFESESHQLPGIYEPSAVQQLSDGRFLVVEDEKARPFSAFSFDAAGGAQTSELKPRVEVQRAHAASCLPIGSCGSSTGIGGQE